MPQTLGHNDLKKYVFSSLQLESRKEQNRLKGARAAHSENHYCIWSTGWGKHPQLTVCLWFGLNVTGLAGCKESFDKGFLIFYVAISWDLKDHNCSPRQRWSGIWSGFCLGLFFSKENGLERKRN